MDVLITILMKTPYMYGSLIIKDKGKNNLKSSLFVLSVSRFLSSFFVTNEDPYIYGIPDNEKKKDL